MRRSRLLTLLGGSLLAAFLLPSLAVAATPAATTPTADPTIRLRCALVIPAGSPARERVGCGWTARPASMSAPIACGRPSMPGWAAIAT